MKNVEARLQRLESQLLCPLHREPYHCLDCDITASEAEEAFVSAMVAKIGPECFGEVRYAEVPCVWCGEPALCLACQPSLDEAGQARYLEGVCRLTEDEQHRLADIMSRAARRQEFEQEMRQRGRSAGSQVSYSDYRSQTQQLRSPHKWGTPERDEQVKAKIRQKLGLQEEGRREPSGGNQTPPASNEGQGSAA